MIDLSSLCSDVMAVTPRGLQMLDAQVKLLATNGFQGVAAGRTPKGQRSGKVQVIPISGVLIQKGDWISELLGYSSAAQIAQAVTEAAADPSIDEIILDINSPGGSVYGIQEAGDAIYAARSKKPVTAIANALAASAAYWLGSQATRFLMLPSGEVGSIGVIIVHEDWSKFLDTKGIKTTYITAGRYKAEGNPDEPLDDTAKAFLRSRADEYYRAFVDAVARGRGVSSTIVQSTFGEGRVFGSAQAVRARMVDGVANSMLDALKRNASTTSSRPGLARAKREIELLTLS